MYKCGRTLASKTVFELILIDDTDRKIFEFRNTLHPFACLRDFCLREILQCSFFFSAGRDRHFEIKISKTRKGKEGIRRSEREAATEGTNTHCMPRYMQ